MLTDTREMTSEYRLQYWAEILQKQKESGMNIKLYCEEIGIKEHRYYYWQRKLRAVANNELSKAQSDIRGLTPSIGNSPVVWAGVDMHTLDAQSSRSAMDCSTPNNIKICRQGWTVMVEPGFDAESLTEVLRVVSRTCY
jgi:hypothetical protein